MTDQELLQQAKDQVAQAYKGELMTRVQADFKTWKELHTVMCRPNYRVLLNELHDRAALQAIQSAREEAVYLVWKTDKSEREELQAVCIILEDAEQVCNDLRKTAGREQVFFTRIEPFKKLTAPGR